MLICHRPTEEAVKFEIKADDDFLKKFNSSIAKLDKKVSNKIANEVLSAVGDVYKEDVQQAISRSIRPSKVTGTRDMWSRKVRGQSFRGPNKSLTKKTAIRKYRGRSKGAKWIMVSPAQDYFYARILEKGTEQHPLWRKKGSSNANKIGTLPPRPVFLPTAKKSLPKMYNTFKREFTLRVNKAIIQARFS